MQRYLSGVYHYKTQYRMAYRILPHMDLLVIFYRAPPSHALTFSFPPLSRGVLASYFSSPATSSRNTRRWRHAGNSAAAPLDNLVDIYNHSATAHTSPTAAGRAFSYHPVGDSGHSVNTQPTHPTPVAALQTSICQVYLPPDSFAFFAIDQNHSTRSHGSFYTHICTT